MKINDFIIEETEFTPQIFFSAKNRKLIFKGVSRPEDVIKFYKPVVNWLKEFELCIIQQPDLRYQIPLIVIEFRLTYFNSASSKMLLEILQIIKRINEKIDVQIDWYYDANDESMLEDGQDLSEVVDLPFNFHKL